MLSDFAKTSTTFLFPKNGSDRVSWGDSSISNEDTAEPKLRNDSPDDDGVMSFTEDSPRCNKGKIVLSLGDSDGGLFDAWPLSLSSSQQGASISTFEAIKRRPSVDRVGGNSVDTGVSV